MVKTDTQNLVGGTSQSGVTPSKTGGSGRAKDDPVERTTQSSTDDSETMMREEIPDVARARDVYMRTADGAAPEPGGALVTSEEATELVETLKDGIRREPRKALEAQGKGISPHRAELLRE